LASSPDVPQFVLTFCRWFPINCVFSAGYDFPTTVQEIFAGWTLDEEHTFNETWAEMERLHSSGKARAIGVSNFSIKTYVFFGPVSTRWMT
jgi:hypothetical protein